MKLALASVCVAAVALAASAAAQAHDYYLDIRHGQAASLEGMIAGYRASHGLFATVPNLQTMTAVISIQQANWQEAKFGKRIGGEPFEVWSQPIFLNEPRGIMAGIRCHIGETWKPARAFRSFKRKQASRTLMLLPFWSWMSVRSAVVHRHDGYYKGKGRCQAYYVVFAAPLLDRRS